MTVCAGENIAKTFLTRITIMRARPSGGTRGSGPCAAWISPVATPNGAARCQPTPSSPAISDAFQLIAAVPFGAHFVQDRLDGGVGLQHGGPHYSAEFAPRLPKSVARSLY